MYLLLHSSHGFIWAGAKSRSLEQMDLYRRFLEFVDVSHVSDGTHVRDIDGLVMLRIYPLAKLEDGGCRIWLLFTYPRRSSLETVNNGRPGVAMPRIDTRIVP